MNIVVLGGGTAGWLSALFLKKSSPDSNVTVVHSTKIGTIGVGEATVPAFVDFLDSIGIHPSEIISECGGTIKHGISFENWNGDETKYMHPFSERLVEFSVPNIFSYGCSDFYIKNLINEKKEISQYMYSSLSAYNNKVDPENISYALHFDASRLASYLEKVGKARGIYSIDGEMVDVVQDGMGYVTKLLLDDNRAIDVDFMVDASGSARAVIGKVYGQKWISRREQLPMSRAIPFWLEEEAEPRPYTRSIAMSSGWMWQIPVEGRVGAGYVFDDSFITAEEAQREVESLLGRSVDIRKDIPFEAGESESFWVKNVMSIGLASAFVEPLESTSIWVTTQQLIFLLQFLPDCSRPNDGTLRIFNREMQNTMEVIRSFIYLHYLTERQDAEFWRGFKDNTKVPDMLQEVLEDIRMGDVRWTNFERGLCRFDLASYLHVIAGVRLAKSLPSHKNIFPSIKQYKSEIDQRSSSLPLHSDVIASIKSSRI